MDYKKILDAEMKFLKTEVKEMKARLVSCRDDEERYMKSLRCYLAVQKRYLEVQKEISSAEAKEDELLLFNGQ